MEPSEKAYRRRSATVLLFCFLAQLKSGLPEIPTSAASLTNEQGFEIGQAHLIRLAIGAYCGRMAAEASQLLVMGSDNEPHIAEPEERLEMKAAA